MPDGLFSYPTQAGTRWGVRIKYKHDDGRWRAKTWRGFRKHREAQQFLEARREDRYRAKFFPGSTAEPTVAAYFEAWLHTYAARNCKYSTYTSYARVLNRYLLPDYGNLPLRALSVADLKAILARLHGRRRQTVRNVFGPIREGLTHAMAEGLIPTNPAAALAPHLRQIRDPKHTVHPFTPRETARLLAAAATIGQQIAAAVHLGVRAGLRASEILGLQWDDLDVKQRTVTIRHTRVWRRDATPKSHKQRTVHLPASVTRALARCPRHPTSPIVLHQDGRHRTQDWLTYHYRQVLAAAQLPRRRLHDLRHTYASQLIALGCNPKYIQDQLGHSTIAVTFDVYGHLFPTTRHADQLDRQAR